MQSALTGSKKGNVIIGLVEEHDTDYSGEEINDTSSTASQQHERDKGGSE